MRYSWLTMHEHRGGLLAHMENDDFLKSVQNAQHEADEADSSRATLVLWAQRLLPYLNDNPHLTIAQAMDLYLAEHGPE